MAEPLRFPRFLTESQVAEVLGVSVDTVARMRKRGAIPFRMIGRRVKFTEDDVLAYIDGSRVAPCERLGKTASPAPSSTEASGSSNARAPEPGCAAGTTPPTANQARAELHSALSILRPQSEHSSPGSRSMSALRTRGRRP